MQTRKILAFRPAHPAYNSTELLMFLPAWIHSVVVQAKPIIHAKERTGPGSRSLKM